MNKASLKKISFGICIVAALVCALLGWQARNFEIDASADTLLMKDNKHYLVTQQAAERYNPAEFILIAYKPHKQSIFSTNTLQTLERIGQDIEAIERVKSVRSLVNVPIFTGLKQLSVNINADQLTWKAQQYPPEELKRKLTSHPLYEDLLFNSEQTAVGMQVVFRKPKPLKTLQSEIVAIQSHLLERELSSDEQKTLDRLKERKAKIDKELDKQRITEIEKIRDILSSYEDTGEFFLGGNNLLAYQLIKIIKSDLVIFGSLILVIISLVLFYLFRQFRWVILPLICCAASVTCTLGLLAILGLKVTVISANVIALQIILSLALIIHLIVQYQELIKEGYKNQQDLVVETIKRKLKPCFYAGFTTTIGFGSLIFSGVQPVISFGWMMVVAMLVTLAVSLILFPALLLALFTADTKVKRHRFITTLMTRGTNVVLHRPTTIIASGVLLTAIGIAGCFRLTAENSFLNYFSESTDVYRELSFIDQHFGGSTAFDILYNVPKSQQKEGLELSASAVQTVSDIQRKLASHSAVGNITSIADFTLIARTVAGKPLTEYELTALYRGLDEDLKTDLFGSYFDKEHEQIRISTRIKDSTPELNREALLQDIRHDLEQLGVPEENYQLTNLFVLYQDILSRLVKSQFFTLGIVYLAMALVLWMIFKSIKVAAIALVPNVITTASIMGAMGIFGIPLDLMTLTIAAVAMGISVDDTIHYVHRYLEENQTDPENAVKHSHLSVGYALIYTTGVIILGFASLMFSDFVPSILFGLLTSAAMAIALITDITILPVLLNRFIGRAAPAIKSGRESS
ncbi:MAG TPA: efflux RND transporter permease subunit [Marinagarivorans sp.]